MHAMVCTEELHTIRFVHRRVKTCKGLHTGTACKKGLHEEFAGMQRLAHRSLQACKGLHTGIAYK